MRPRSKLLSKRRLVLPTITEGTEEAVRDLNEANMLHITGHGQAVSSEDYLLSICHLAHPTFPARDVSPDSIHARRLESVQQRPRPSRLSGAEEEQNQTNPKLIFGNSDPLEYIYGLQDHRSVVEGRFARPRGSAWDGPTRSRAHSIPRPSSPKLSCQRKSSCHEFHGGTVPPDVSTTDRCEGGRANRAAEGKRQNLVVKQSLISQWISDCRAALREARVRACMLPAIAEI